MKTTLLIFALGFCSVAADAQTVPWRYLGTYRVHTIKYSPLLHIAYDDGGFENPTEKAINKSIKHLAQIGHLFYTADLRAFSSQDFGAVVDAQSLAALKTFTDCGGPIADKARGVNLAGVTILMQESLFPVSFSPTGWAAGEYDPALQQIRAVNFYVSAANGDYSSFGPLVKYEQENHIGTAMGIPVEPIRWTDKAWPCDQKPE